MSSTAQRKSPRVDVALDVTLQTVDGDVPCQTRDASYQGVFIVQRDPLPLRKLIRFRTRLPDTDEELQMLGLVAHTVNAAEAAEHDRDPGMGIQLFSLGQNTSQRWRQFIDELYEQDPRARQTLESSRRPTVQMRVPDDESLQRLRTVDLPRGQVFVRTPDLHPDGTQLDCVITLPDDETVTLAATVIEAVEGSVEHRGLHLAVQLPDDRQQLEEALGAPVPEDTADEATPPDDIPDAPDQEEPQ